MFTAAMFKQPGVGRDVGRPFAVPGANRRSPAVNHLCRFGFPRLFCGLGAGISGFPPLLDGDPEMPGRADTSESVNLHKCFKNKKLK